MGLLISLILADLFMTNFKANKILNNIPHSGYPEPEPRCCLGTAFFRFLGTGFWNR